VQNLFGDEVFSKIKKGARIVNVARGGVIDDAALARALDAGQVAAVRSATAATHFDSTPCRSLGMAAVWCKSSLGWCGCGALHMAMGQPQLKGGDPTMLVVPCRQSHGCEVQTNILWCCRRRWMCLRWSRRQRGTP
jgi:D-isomer specific 2-hydroxyacid dehydrogenase, NAD binding domain